MHDFPSWGEYKPSCIKIPGKLDGFNVTKSEEEYRSLRKIANLAISYKTS